MPYIKQEERKQFDPFINLLVKHYIKSNAQLTYVLYAISVRWFKKHFMNHTWENCSDVLKCIHSAHHEFERKFVDGYEDLKIEKNGDIF